MYISLCHAFSVNLVSKEFSVNCQTKVKIQVTWCYIVAFEISICSEVLSSSYPVTWLVKFTDGKAASCLGTQVILAFVISDTGTDHTANDVLPLIEIQSFFYILLKSLRSMWRSDFCLQGGNLQFSGKVRKIWNGDVCYTTMTIF